VPKDYMQRSVLLGGDWTAGTDQTYKRYQ